MTTTQLTVLGIVLVFLVFFSAFFSSSETGMMSLNRYRLRHLVLAKKREAIRVSKLLERVDRLLSVILIGNTFANIMASAVATFLAIHFFGDLGVAIATVGLTLIVLIFGEIAPKTLASLYPQKVAFLVSLPLSWLLKILYPIVWLGNAISNGLLGLLGIDVHRPTDHFTSEELRTIVKEASGRIPDQHQTMLLRILDLEKITVDDIMVPRSEVLGINLEDDWEQIHKLLITCHHTRLPVYRDNIDNVEGVIHLRTALNYLAKGRLDKEAIVRLTQEAYFVPEGTPLTTQLLNFRKEKHRMALVVDEYGDILGLVSVQDILEEIVGEVSSEVPSVSKLVRQEADGRFLVDGSINLRELNRLMNWYLPTEGPKTLNGLILEYLESIPAPGTCVLLNGYPVEITAVKENRVMTAVIAARLDGEYDE